LLLQLQGISAPHVMVTSRCDSRAVHAIAEVTA
jgi:hypothetical protein